MPYFYSKNYRGDFDVYVPVSEELELFLEIFNRNFRVFCAYDQWDFEVDTYLDKMSNKNWKIVEGCGRVGEIAKIEFKEPIEDFVSIEDLIAYSKKVYDNPKKGIPNCEYFINRNEKDNLMSRLINLTKEQLYILSFEIPNIGYRQKQIDIFENYLSEILAIDNFQFGGVPDDFVHTLDKENLSIWYETSLNALYEMDIKNKGFHLLLMNEFFKRFKNFDETISLKQWE